MPRIPTPLIQRHWFVLLLPLWAGVLLAWRGFAPWIDQPRLAEATLLFDLCVFLPALYGLCYRALPWRRLGVRMIAVAATGWLIASWAIPPAAHDVLATHAWVRHVAVAIIVLAELAVFVQIVRMAYSRDADAAAITAAGVPPALARLMLAEARFWRALWRLLRRPRD